MSWVCAFRISKNSVIVGGTYAGRLEPPHFLGLLFGNKQRELHINYTVASVVSGDIILCCYSLGFSEKGASRSISL